jgi:hypothetical protein
MFERLPLIILAGSDEGRSAVPDQLQADDMLDGPKGDKVLRSGRCLVEELVHSVRESDCFSDIVIVGPKRRYGGKVSCDVVDVEGNLVNTLQSVVDTVQARYDVQQPVALSSCDILPTAGDFRSLLNDSYAAHRESHFWWQMVEATAEQMGASHWKPAYHFPEAPGEPQRRLYPGHLVVTRVASLRIHLGTRLLQLAYRYRNRMLRKRYLGITLRMLGTLISEDLRNLLAGKPPTLTFSVPYRGLSAYFKYQRRELTLRDYERAVASIMLHREFHRSSGGRPVVISISPIVSFAKDIDTVAELEELGELDPPA